MWGVIIIGIIMGIIIGILMYFDFEDLINSIGSGMIAFLLVFLMGLVINLIVSDTAKCQVESVTTYVPVAVETYYDGEPKYYYEFEDAWGFAVEQEETKKLEKIIALKSETTIRESDERKVEVYKYNYESKVLRFFFVDAHHTEYVIYGPKNEVAQSFRDLT